MKANVPERIWINRSDLPKLSGVMDKDSVQYIQANAFIERAKNYLKDQFIKDVSVLFGGVVHINFSTAIKNFVNYMKGE